MDLSLSNTSELLATVVADQGLRYLAFLERSRLNTRVCLVIVCGGGTGELFEGLVLVILKPL